MSSLRRTLAMTGERSVRTAVGCRLSGIRPKAGDQRFPSPITLEGDLEAFAWSVRCLGCRLVFPSHLGDRGTVLSGQSLEQ
jgi:hypothetical protein